MMVMSGLVTAPSWLELSLLALSVSIELHQLGVPFLAVVFLLPRSRVSVSDKFLFFMPVAAVAPVSFVWLP